MPRNSADENKAQLYHSAARKFEQFRSMRGAAPAAAIHSRFITAPRRRIADLPPEDLTRFIAALDEGARKNHGRTV